MIHLLIFLQGLLYSNVCHFFQLFITESQADNLDNSLVVRSIPQAPCYGHVTGLPTKWILLWK